MNSKAKTFFIIFTTMLLIGGLVVSLHQVFKTRQELSETQQLIIEDKGERVMTYFETIDFHSDKYIPGDDEQTAKTDQIAKYISFAVTLISDEQSKNIVSVDEASKIITENFVDSDYKTDDYLLACSSVILNLNEIVCDESQHEFIINKSTDPRTIAATPIIKYLPKETTSKSADYTATYERYVISGPYDILNYAAEAESPLAPQVKSYLEGTGTIRSIKDAITHEAAEKYGEKTGEITVSFSVDNGKFRVKSFREN